MSLYGKEKLQVHNPLKPRSKPESLDIRVRALENILEVREKELIDLKGPCSNPRCSLHYAHSLGCDTRNNHD